MNNSTFNIQNSKFIRTFVPEIVHLMQKKEIIVNVILAVALIVLLVICVRSVTHEMKAEDKRNQIENARKQ